MKAHELQRNLCLNQLEERLRDGLGDEEQRTRQAFLKLFATSSFGLGLNFGAGKRSSDIQSKSRAELIKQSNAQHPNPKMPGLWCPLTAEYLDSSLISCTYFPIQAWARYNGRDIRYPRFPGTILTFERATSQRVQRRNLIKG